MRCLCASLVSTVGRRTRSSRSVATIGARYRDRRPVLFSMPSRVEKQERAFERRLLRHAEKIGVPKMALHFRDGCGNGRRTFEAGWRFILSVGKRLPRTRCGFWIQGIRRTRVACRYLRRRWRGGGSLLVAGRGRRSRPVHLCGRSSSCHATQQHILREMISQCQGNEIRFQTEHARLGRGAWLDHLEQLTMTSLMSLLPPAYQSEDGCVRK